MRKKLILLLGLLLIISLNVSSCVTTPQIIYKDIAPDEMVLKRQDLKDLVDELIITRFQLLQCYERLRVK